MGGGTARARARGDPRQKGSYAAALKAGVTLCAGGDTGVFPHGDNAREIELMAAWGLAPGRCAAGRDRGQCPDTRNGTIESARSRPAGSPIWSRSRAIPTADIAALRAVRLVMQDGMIVRAP
jgi:hypothetical protein